MAGKREKDQGPTAANATLEGIHLSSVYLNCLIETLGELKRVDIVNELVQTHPPLAVIVEESSPTVPLSLLLKAYLFAQNLLGDTAFGIRMGRNLKISSHGALSNLLISAPNLKAAIECLAPYYDLRAPFLNIKLEERGERAAGIIDFTFMQNTTLEQIMGGLLTGVALNVIKFYGFDTTDEIEVNIHPLNQQHIGLYQELFSLTPHEGRKTFVISFPSRFLQVASPLADQELFDLAIKNCQQLKDNKKDASSTLGERLKEMIVANPEGDWSQEAIAAIFHMSVSTLRRRLSREGLTYKEVVSSAKMHAAKSLLLRSELQITAVSQQLGFSDASNFASAFKRHTGLTPREFRSQFLGNR